MLRNAPAQVTDLRSSWEVDSVLRDIMTGLADCSAPARRLRYRCRSIPPAFRRHTAVRWRSTASSSPAAAGHFAGSVHS